MQQLHHLTSSSYPTGYIEVLPYKCFIKQRSDGLGLDIAQLPSPQKNIVYAVLCIIQNSVRYLIFLFAVLGQTSFVPSESLQ